MSTVTYGVRDAFCRNLERTGSRLYGGCLERPGPASVAAAQSGRREGR
jgi:hypothetical protein